MSRVDVLIYDIAQVLCELPMATPNRHALFIKTLESLVRYANSEEAVKMARNVRDDLVRISDIQARSKY